MKQYKNLLIGAMGALCLLMGCTTAVSPYDYADNWLIRENDIPQYRSSFDLFYIGDIPAGYGDSRRDRFNWVRTHTNDVFGDRVRVFAPQISDPDAEKMF